MVAISISLIGAIRNDQRPGRDRNIGRACNTYLTVAARKLCHVGFQNSVFRPSGKFGKLFRDIPNGEFPFQFSLS